MSAVTVKVDGHALTEVVSMTLSRDLKNIAGTFSLEVVDETRLMDALIAYIGQPGADAVRTGPGLPIEIAIDGEVVLIGWIDQARYLWTADSITARISGRDKTGDLVDCAALPLGPTEFHGVDLLHVATEVCASYGIGVTADVDIGAPFARLSLHKHMTALAFLEPAARQRSILLTSDGVGGLKLTRGGTSRAPAPLRIGDNIHLIDAEYDWSHRFSDYYVMQDSVRGRTGGPALDHTVTPLSGAAPPAAAPAANSAAEAAAIGNVGHAIDPEIARYRPTVRLTRSQSGMSTVQEQAEWMARVAKGNALPVRAEVLGFRAGAGSVLWRPNQLSSLWDPYSGFDRDMLIAGVTFIHDASGQRTELRLVGPSAYDRINEADRKRNGKSPAAKQKLDRTVQPLSAP